MFLLNQLRTVLVVTAVRTCTAFVNGMLIGACSGNSTEAERKCFHKTQQPKHLPTLLTGEASANQTRWKPTVLSCSRHDVNCRKDPFTPVQTRRTLARTLLAAEGLTNEEPSKQIALLIGTARCRLKQANYTILYYTMLCYTLL